MSLSIDQIASLLSTRGSRQYGSEAVSQSEHALQCAALAEAAGATPQLVIAALLHDLGHLVHDLGDDPAIRGTDDVHQYQALPFLRAVFGDEVLEPIRLHVDAKRYLCATEEEYHGRLSAASRRSLELQGDIYAPEVAAAFIRQPHAADAVMLRRWDDEAKMPGRETPGLDHYVHIMKTCQL